MKTIKSIYGERCKKIAWTKKYIAGYILQKEFLEMNDKGEGDWMTVAYNHQGDFIGDNKMAYFLCVKKRLKPELISKEHKVCSIGYCYNENKWYGWSHRAMYGFGIGYIVLKGSSESITNECLKKDLSVPVGFKIKTLADAKKVAIAFATDVS